MFPLFPYRVYNHTAQGHLHLLSQHQERLLTAPALPRGFSSVLTAFDQSLKTVLGTGKRHVECSVEWNVLDSKTVVEKEVIRSLAPPVCAVKRPLLRYLSNTDAGCDLPSIFLRRPFRDDSSQFLECFALDTSRSLARPLAGCETMAGYPLLTPSSIPIYRFQYSGIDVPADVLPPFINSTITEDTFDFAMDSGARELPSAPLAMPNIGLQRVVAELLGPTVFPFIDSSCHLHQASPHDIHESPLMPSLSETAEELTLTPRPLQAAETMFGSHATIWRVMNAPKDIVWELETTDIDRKLALTYKDPISLLQLGGGICCPRTLHLPQEPSLISLWVTENTLPSDVLGHYCPCGSAADVLGHCCPCGSAADVLLFPQRVFLERLVPVEGRDPKSPHINPLKRQRRDPTPIPHEESDLQGRFAEPAPTAYPLPVDVEASRSKAAQLIKILEALEGPAQTVELPPVDALEPEDLPEMVVWPKAAWELHLEYSIRKMQELPLGAELMSLCKSSPLECLAALKIAVKHSQDATLHEIAADALSCSVTVLDGGRCVLTPAEVNLPERFSPENALLEDVEAAFMGLMTDVWGAELSLLVLTSALAQQVKGCAAVLSPSENYSRLFRCAWSWWNELTRAMSNRHFVSYASVFQADLTPLRPLRVSPEASQPKTYLSDVPDNCWLVAPSGLQFDLKDRDLFRCARWRVNTWVGTQPAAPCLPVIASPLSGLVDVADDLAEGLVGDAALIGPSCAMLLASKEDFRENFLACSRTFKLVFPVNLGPLECSESLSWLLAEDTASLRDLISQLQQTYLHSEIHASLAKPTDRNNFMHRVALLSGLDLPTDLFSAALGAGLSLEEAAALLDMDPSVWEAVTSAVDAADPPSAETDPTHWDNSTGSEPVWGADGSVVPRSPVKSFTRREAHQKSPFPRGTQSDSTTNFFVMKEEDSGCDAWSETLDADWGQAAEVERAADASWPVESKTQYAECEEDTFTTWSDLWQEKESKVVSSNIQTSLFDRRRVAVPQNTQRSWELPELPVIWNEHPTAPPSERTFAKGTHPGYGPLPELCRGSDEGKHGFCRRPSTLHRLKRAYKNLHKRR